MKNNRTSIAVMVALTAIFINCKPESQVVHDKNVELVAADQGTTTSPLLANITAFIDIADGQASDTEYDSNKPVLKVLTLSDFKSTFEIPVGMLAAGQDIDNLNVQLVANKAHYISTSVIPIKFDVVRLSCEIKNFQYAAFNTVMRAPNEMSYLAHAPCDNNQNFGVAIEVKFPATDKPKRVTYTVHFGYYDGTEVELLPKPHQKLKNMVSYKQSKILPLEW